MDDRKKNLMTLEALKIVHFMTEHGFYACQEDINSVARSVISLLNGSNDKMRNGDRITGQSRYLQDPLNDLVVEIKQKGCDILQQLSCLETDSKCSVFIAKLKRDIEDTE